MLPVYDVNHINIIPNVEIQFVIDNRIKQVLDRIIHKDQTGFY